MAHPHPEEERAMRQYLTPQELTDQFTMLPQEHGVLANKSGVNRWGFVVLFKYCQWEGRFPEPWQEVPRSLVQHIAATRALPADESTTYDLTGRTARYHKEQIRESLGFRPGTTTDADTITAWGCTQTRLDDATVPQLTERLMARYKTLGIEPPTPLRLARLAHSALHTIEDHCFTTLGHALTPETCQRLDGLLHTDPPGLSLTALKADGGPRHGEGLLTAVDTLRQLQALQLPEPVLAPLSARYLRRLPLRGTAESLTQLRRHPDPRRYALVTLFCYSHMLTRTDRLIELLLQLVHKMGTQAEKRGDEELLTDFKRVPGKTRLLFQMAAVALDHPAEAVQEVIYPVVGVETLRNLVTEGAATGHFYRDKVQRVMQGSYSHHYRRMVPALLDVLAFQSNNDQHQPVIEALAVLRQYASSKQRYYGLEADVPLDGVVPPDARTTVVEPDAKGHPRIHRINYELHVLQALRERLRCKEIWVPGAPRYRNPEEDLPGDFPEARNTYYQALEQPVDPDTFMRRLQHQMHQALQTLDTGMPQNPGVQLLLRPKGWMRVSPLDRLPEPLNLAHLKAEITRRWPMTSLLDVLKETERRVGLTPHFMDTGTRVGLDEATLQRRLLLWLFGLGTNTGLTRVCAATPEEQYHDLLYVRRRYLHPEALRNAIAHVVNAIFRIRATHIWGEGTTACASDAKQFGAWDQNLLTEWHLRYGGRGVMVYGHVEKRAVCIYSQLKTVSSSEVAAMLEGVLRHGTDMHVEKQYGDTHGPSAVAFAFCHLLNFQLLPRLKGLHRQTLYRPTTGQPEAYPHLQAILPAPYGGSSSANSMSK